MLPAAFCSESSNNCLSLPRLNQDLLGSTWDYLRLYCKPEPETLRGSLTRTLDFASSCDLQEVESDKFPSCSLATSDFLTLSPVISQGARWAISSQRSTPEARTLRGYVRPEVRGQLPLALHRGQAPERTESFFTQSLLFITYSSIPYSFSHKLICFRVS